MKEIEEHRRYVPGSWDDRLGEDRNSFDLVRLILATLVVFEHSFFLVDNSVARDPLYIFSHGQTNFGALAVWMFFAVSGFLVTMSAVRSRSVFVFLTKRIARIGPGFWVASIIGWLFVGPLAAKDVGLYFTEQNWLVFIVRAVSLHATNPVATLAETPLHLVHGTLWSIKYEFDCYTILGVAIILLRWVRLRSF